jgi:multidrug efflux pump subunit AcrB
VRRERVRLVAEQAALERLAVSEAAVNRELRALLAARALAPTTDRAAPGDWPVAFELARADRGVLERLLAAPVETRDGPVELGQLVRVERETTDLPIFRRNGRDVVMVMATLAGAREAPVYGMLAAAERLEGDGIAIAYRGQPLFPDEPVLLWHGEWEITYTTFRDMGLAFLGAFLLIYAIAVAHFRRFKLPIVIMTPVPLTLLGVILGHWLIGAKFTATSMIGFIALAGIVVRNSVLLVEFVEARRAQGAAVREAVLEAGAVRFRPILLTAVTAMVGALFIMADPIFKGLAVSLFFGLISSTLLTTIAIPAIYVWRRAGHDEAG